MRRFLTRPFSAAHWALSVVLGIFWEVAALQPCAEPPYYFQTVLATASVCIALWVNHLASGHLQGVRRIARIVGGAVYDLLTVFLLLIAVTIPIAFFMPAYQCYTPRAKVTEALLYASSLRAQITERAIAAKTMANSGSGMKVSPAGRVTGGLVTADGMIVVVTEDPPAVISMTPEYVNGKVDWRCLGYPSKVMPATCRE